jgi:hypothetical protein
MCSRHVFLRLWDFVVEAYTRLFIAQGDLVHRDTIEDLSIYGSVYTSILNESLLEHSAYIIGHLMISV